MNEITQRQKEFLDFIIKFKDEKGYSPTLREIAKEMKVTVSAVAQNIKALAVKEYLSYTFKISRSIVVLKKGDYNDN